MYERTNMVIKITEFTYIKQKKKKQAIYNTVYIEPPITIRHSISKSVQFIFCYTCTVITI